MRRLRTPLGLLSALLLPSLANAQLQFPIGQTVSANGGLLSTARVFGLVDIGNGGVADSASITSRSRVALSGGTFAQAGLTQTFANTCMVTASASMLNQIGYTVTGAGPATGPAPNTIEVRATAGRFHSDAVSTSYGGSGDPPNSGGFTSTAADPVGAWDLGKGIRVDVPFVATSAIPNLVVWGGDCKLTRTDSGPQSVGVSGLGYAVYSDLNSNGAVDPGEPVVLNGGVTAGPNQTGEQTGANLTGVTTGAYVLSVLLSPSSYQSLSLSGPCGVSDAYTSRIDETYFLKLSVL